MSAALEQVSRAAERITREREDGFNALALALANNGTIDELHAAEVLDQAGKTGEHLAAAVQVIATRWTHRAALDDGDQAVADIRRLDADRAAIDAELAAAQRRHPAAMAPVEAKAAAARDRVAAAHEAKRHRHGDSPRQGS